MLLYLLIFLIFLSKKRFIYNSNRNSRAFARWRYSLGKKLSLLYLIQRSRTFSSRAYLHNRVNLINYCPDLEHRSIIDCSMSLILFSICICICISMQLTVGRFIMWARTIVPYIVRAQLMNLPTVNCIELEYMPCLQNPKLRYINKVCIVTS